MAMTTATGMSTLFDGRTDLTTALDAGFTFRTPGGTLGLALVDVFSSGGSAWSWECRGGMTARASGAITLDAAADLRIDRLRAARDAEGRPVASDTTAILPSVGGRLGVTWRSWPGASVNVSAAARTSLWHTDREYTHGMCTAAPCEGTYRFGGFGYGVSVTLAAAPSGPADAAPPSAGR